MNKKTTADKLGTKTIETKAVAKRLTPFEDLVHLAAIGRLSLAGRQDIGAIILKKKDSFQIKFCFDCKGIHPSLPESQVYPIFAGIEAGLKELPKGELLTLHIGSFTDDSHRQQTLKTIEENCTQDELKMLARSERLRIRELTQQGIRKTKFFSLYCNSCLKCLCCRPSPRP